MSLHGKKGLGKKNRKGWHYNKILVHLKEFAPHDKESSSLKFSISFLNKNKWM